MGLKEVCEQEEVLFTVILQPTEKPIDPPISFVQCYTEPRRADKRGAAVWFFIGVEAFAEPIFVAHQADAHEASSDVSKGLQDFSKCSSLEGREWCSEAVPVGIGSCQDAGVADRRENGRCDAGFKEYPLSCKSIDVGGPNLVVPITAQMVRTKFIYRQ